MVSDMTLSMQLDSFRDEAANGLRDENASSSDKPEGRFVPVVIANCTECGCRIKSMGPDHVNDAWVYSCRNKSCGGSSDSGKGSLRIQLSGKSISQLDDRNITIRAKDIIDTGNIKDDSPVKPGSISNIAGRILSQIDSPSEWKES
jgi:hypothetical protein